MKETSSKVVIVGAGNVGCTLAYTLINQSLCNELVLIDLNEEKTLGEVLDMQHATYFMDGDIKVKAGKYEDCQNADIVIITASAPMDRNAKDRTTMLAPTKKIMKSVVSSIMNSGFDGILLVVSNPLDVMTYYAWKLSGLDTHKVIGSGTLLDSARLCKSLSSRLNVNAKSIQAEVLGEHGATEMIPWSNATIHGASVKNLLAESDANNLDVIEKENIMAGFEILRRKGNTSYGIAASVATIVKAILKNENKVLPVSTYVDGFLRANGCFISLPCVLNKDGVKEYIPVQFNDEEKERFNQSIESITSFYPYLED